MKTSQSTPILQNTELSSLDASTDYSEAVRATRARQHHKINARQSISTKSVRPMKSMARVKSVKPNRINGPLLKLTR